MKLSRFVNLRSSFLKDVFTLTAGTTFAQALPILITPILTRYFFTPEDFGILAVFMSVSGILSVGVTGGYENAIVLPEKEKDAVNLAGLSASLTTVISAAVFFCLFFPVTA
jgi:O-antigen/teichoic acid export membrane protein